MKQLSLLLALLLLPGFVFSTPQTTTMATHRFAISSVVYNPQYSFGFGLWNPNTSGKPVYLDRIEIQAGFSASAVVEYGVTFLVTPLVAGCTNAIPMNLDQTDPAMSVTQANAQPCSTGAYPSTVGSNIVAPILSPGGSQYIADYSANPIKIPPGRGLGIFVGEAFSGQASYTVWIHE